MKISMPTVTKIRPKVRRTLRALGGRRVVVEGYGRRSPVFITIAGGGETPSSAWLSTGELRRLVEIARRIIK